MAAVEATIFQDILQYDWDADSDFQEGLQAILSSLPPDTEQSPELIDRAKCFFWGKRTDQPISYEEYAQFKNAFNGNPGSTEGQQRAQENGSGTMNGAPSAPAPSASSTAAPYPQSFADIVELINSGKPIPGIKEIPNKLNEAPPTEPVREKRRKPWEVSTPAPDATS